MGCHRMAPREVHPPQLRQAGETREAPRRHLLADGKIDTAKILQSLGFGKQGVSVLIRRDMQFLGHSPAKDPVFTKRDVTEPTLSVLDRSLKTAAPQPLSIPSIGRPSPPTLVRQLECQLNPDELRPFGIAVLLVPISQQQPQRIVLRIRVNRPG